MRLAFLLALAATTVLAADPLPGTAPLTREGDLSAQMVEGINHWLARETAAAAEARHAAWQAATAGPSWKEFAEAKRKELREIIGAVDPKVPSSLQIESAEHWEGIIPHRVVRWEAFEGVHGEGMLIEAKGHHLATVIALPDATGYLPASVEALSDAGCSVLIIETLGTDDTWSRSDAMGRATNQPHREWIYRQAFELGRTPIGFEVEKVLAAAELFPKSEGPLLLMGYGEGGLVALHAAALEPRFQGVYLGGSFGPHTALYHEPIYRNRFGFLRDFDDAELAALAYPCPLFVEIGSAKTILGPPEPEKDKKGAAPGIFTPPSLAETQQELAWADRYRSALQHEEPPSSLLHLRRTFNPVTPVIPDPVAKPVASFLRQAGIPASALEERSTSPVRPPTPPNSKDLVGELEAYCQSRITAEERFRDQAVWSHLKPGPEWDKAKAELKERLWASIGKLPGERPAPNPRARQILDQPKWTGYEVTLDVRPDVFAWGYLLVPKDLKPGERRPVVVCQHGLEGVPGDVVAEDEHHPAFHYYHGFAAKLAEQGFIVYAPHNPYRGQDQFRQIQRRANPLGLSLFSFIIEQHAVTTDWLVSLPFVDPERIAFYGLSYGGKTAMRVPALVDRYCLSICSGDFNEWIRKCCSTEYKGSYLYTGEYEMDEWNLAHNANHAEMALLIAPRPFMVERGHDDGVGTDEWVGYEYAKVRRGYDKLGVGGETEIEWFNGPHMIHGVGTFDFLHRHLNWPTK